MTIRILYFIPILIFFAGCENINNKSKELIDNSMKYANAKIISDNEKDLKAFNDAFQNALNKSTDTITTKKIKIVYSSIISTTKYIDSLKLEMKKLDEKDPNSYKLVEDIFIKNGIADSLFNKLKSSFNFAEKIAQTESVKTDINKRCENIVAETNNESKNILISKKFLFFRLHSPEAEIWTLYGFESELVNSGTISLKDFSESVSLNK